MLTRSLFLSIAFLFVVAAADAQLPPALRSLIGKPMVTDQLNYLQLLSDSTVLTTIDLQSTPMRFFIRNDTFFTGYDYYAEMEHKKIDVRYARRILKLAPDTLILKNYPQGGEDTVGDWEQFLSFVSVERLKEPVADFKFLHMYFSSPWSGERTVSIDSIGRVRVDDRPFKSRPVTDRNRNGNRLEGRLTEKEFAHFKDVLSLALPSRLPPKRYCAIDASTVDLDIIIGRRRIRSRGCYLSIVQTTLFTYLYHIVKEKGFVRKE